MSEKDPREDELQPGEEFAEQFSLKDTKADLSFFLKKNHGLPKVSVDYLLTQFTVMAKKDREDKTLATVLAELVEFVREKRGDHSPMYLAIRDYARDKGANVRASILPGQHIPKEEGQPEKEGDVLKGVAGEVVVQLGEVFGNEPGSAVRKLPDIMNMDLEKAIRYFFPSMGQMLVQTVRMKLIQGPTPEETGDPLWHVKFFHDLVQRFPALAADLEKAGMTVDAVASLLVARAQKEANKAEAVRSERRGPMVTIPGVHVSDLQLYLAKERALAGARKSTPPPKLSDAAAVDELLGQPVADAGNPGAQSDEHTRLTVSSEAGHDIRPFIEGPAVEVVQNEQSDQPVQPEHRDLQKNIATIRVNTADVQAFLATAAVAAADAEGKPVKAGSDEPGPTETLRSSGEVAAGEDPGDAGATDEVPQATPGGVVKLIKGLLG